jgi:preprotein translocase subunit SecB
MVLLPRDVKNAEKRLSPHWFTDPLPLCFAPAKRPIQRDYPPSFLKFHEHRKIIIMAKKPEAAPVEPEAMDGDDTPAIGVISQYVKDLSFENPNAPAVYQFQGQPQIDVQFNIGADQVGEDVHEVTLKIDVIAKNDDQTAFQVELVYAGLFGMRNIPDEQLQPFLLAEGPRIIFPFARRILADTVRDGGFPPLMLEPIDFGSLYMQQASMVAAENGDGVAVGAEGNA